MILNKARTILEQKEKEITLLNALLEAVKLK